MKRIVVGILAHVDSGKTTLSEALMYCSGNISKFGRVDHKNSFLDNFSLERERGITIFSKQAVLNYKNTCFTLLDTPGHVDFSAEAERTLQVLDYAILVISGTDGVQSHTHTLWKLLKKYNVPTIIFVNKMDLAGAHKDSLLLELRGKLSDSCVDFTNTQSGEFMESVAVCDDKLLNKYYDTDTVDKDDIIKAVRDRKIFPCLFGSALKLLGVGELMSLLDNYAVMPQYGGEFSGRVFKISEDGSSRLTYLKITGGSLKVRDVLQSSDNTNDEKVNQIRIYSGEKFNTVNEAEPGTICAVTGVGFTRCGQGLGVEKSVVMPVLEPVLTYRVILPPEIDKHTAFSKLKILESEDPQLNVVWNEGLGDIHLQLMGEIQLEVLKAVIKDRFDFEVSFGTGNIIYKETICDTVEGVGHFEPLRHYAEVHLVLKAGKRGSGLVFKSECREDSLDKNWQRLIMTHLYEKSHLGVLTGSPITDMEITLMSGKAHPKHTEGGDFRQATYRAVRQGLRNAQNVLLEPVYEFVLEIPTENVGRAMSDIQRMCGEFNSPETIGEFSTLTGTAPVSTMDGYFKEVMQYTHGQGRLMCSLKGYEPCHNAEEVIALIGYDPDGDVLNPCGSVFCSHGSGYNVGWNEVPEKMHLPSVFALQQRAQEAYEKRDFTRFKTTEDIFALDKELMNIFEQTYGAVKKRNFNDKPVRIKAQPQSADTNSKRKPAPKYDGEEYLLVDGYNVIFAWDNLRELSKSSLDGARNTLINILCNYQGYRKCNLILVFDAYKIKGAHREIEQVNNIIVVYTKEAETADMYIEKTSHKLAKNNRVRVVTSDGMEQLIILGNGALRVSSRAFFEEVKEAEKEIRRLIGELE